MANKISVILDVATDKAVSGLKGFKQSINDADGAVGKMKAGASSAFDSMKANAGLMGVAVAGAVGTMAAKSIAAASKLGESVNAVNVTFGESAEGIKALGEEAAESVGLSNAAFNSLAVQFSSFAGTVAGEGGDVVGTLDEMTTRIADFASVMNLDVADAAAIFQSSLAGETESIRRFGIDLSAATVETFAYANGFAKVGEKLTEGQKVQARYALLMQETDKTAGDFANTSDGLANSQRILSATAEDTAAKVGQKLAPAMAQVTTMLADVIPIAGKATVAVGDFFTGMVDGAYQAGQGLAQFIDKIPGLDTSEPIAETLYEMEKLERGTADLVAEFSKGAPTMDEFAAKIKDQGLSEHAVSLAIIEYRKQLDGANTVTGEAVGVTDALTGATAELTVSTETSTLAHWDAKESIDAVKRADEAAEEAAEARADAIEDQVEALTALVGGDIAVRDAQRDAAAATRDLTAAQADGSLSAEDLEKKTDDAAGAIIDAAVAAADYDEKIGNAAGKTLDASGKQDLLRDKLLEVAATLAPGSPLLAQIEGYIDALNRIPTDVQTRVFVTSGATGPGQGPIRAPEFAQGGTVPGPIGAPTLAVVHGGETITPANGNGNGNGHAPISITVNAGMGANGQEIGDIIVSELKKYSRRNGPGWVPS